MKKLQERQKRLIARCSVGAAEYLLSLRDHPLFIVVLGRLERIQGNLFQLDIESTFAEVVKRYPLGRSRSGGEDTSDKPLRR